MEQSFLIPLSDAEKVAKLHKALVERGQHSMYCGWDGDKYCSELGCTCGLTDALELLENGD